MFSKASLSKLSTCDQRLQDVFLKVIDSYDCTILAGHRGKAAQNKAFDEGKSKLRWPVSKHNDKPSMAIDVAPYPIDWDNINGFYHFSGYVLGIAHTMGITLRWGGDWDQDNDLTDQSFMDLVHFELHH